MLRRSQNNITGLLDNFVFKNKTNIRKLFNRYQAVISVRCIFMIYSFQSGSWWASRGEGVKSWRSGSRSEQGELSEHIPRLCCRVASEIFPTNHENKGDGNIDANSSPREQCCIHSHTQRQVFKIH